MKNNKGQIPITVMITGALSAITVIGGLFGWTYSQFNSVNAHVSVTDVNVGKLQESISSVKDSIVDLKTAQSRFSENQNALLIKFGVTPK